MFITKRESIVKTIIQNISKEPPDLKDNKNVLNSKKDLRIESDSKISNFQKYLPQILIVAVTNMLLLTDGMTLGVPTIVIPAVDEEHAPENSNLVLNKSQISLFSSINLICVPLGCLLAGPILQKLGRKRTMQIINIPVFISWMLLYFAKNIWFLYGALCLSGLSSGLLESAVVTYVGEITQPALRGVMAALGNVWIIIGITSQFLMGIFLPWRQVALISSVFSMIAMVLLFFIPESPHWLVSMGKNHKALENLGGLRGWASVQEIQDEYKQIHEKISTVTEDNPTGYVSRMDRLRQFTSRGFLMPFFIVMVAFTVRHFSGTTSLQTYAVLIFHTLKSPIDKYYATLLLGVAQILGATICISAVHFTGKRPLALISTIGCGLCFLGTAIYANLLHTVPGQQVANMVSNATAASVNENLEILTSIKALTDNNSFAVEYNDVIKNSMDVMQENEHEFSWIPMTLLLGCALLSHVSVKLLPWMLIGEVFPAKIRAAGAGFASGTGSVFAFTANMLFLSMMSAMTLAGTFYFYAVVSMLGAVVLYFVLPETEGRTLSEIEDHFSGKCPLNSKKNIKEPEPVPSNLNSSKKNSLVIQADNNDLLYVISGDPPSYSETYPTIHICKISESSTSMSNPPLYEECSVDVSVTQITFESEKESTRL